MSVRTLVKPSEYHDSVKLMLVARELAKLAGVRDAAVVMGTDANKSLLEGSGLLTDAVRSAGANDLVIAVSGAEGAADEALAAAERLLSKKAATGAGGGAEFRPRSLRSAVRSLGNANVAVVSVAGRYAAEEARAALHAGLHVLLFSDNVSVLDEISLKQLARSRGLLMMGPGAGTAIVNGVALGFANVLPPGPVGVVSAAGTGLQEVTCLLARHRVGISQGLGTGGRDLRADVGGIMMLEGLRALQADPATKVLLLVSKPPDPSVAAKILAAVAESSKPTVVCFMGGSVPSGPNVIPASTLQEGALRAAHAAGGPVGDVAEVLAAEAAALQERALPLRAGLPEGRCNLRGLFSGGTLCYEAQVLWQDLVHNPVLSNAPLHKKWVMPDSLRSEGHVAVDLGEEEFTVGRPHPMIDMDLRIRRILQESRDPTTGVIVLDVVLGYGAHPDPAGELAPAIRTARQAGVVVIASVTGTEADPQVLSRQTAALQAAGAEVCASNAAAARLAALVVAH